MGAPVVIFVTTRCESRGEGAAGQEWKLLRFQPILTSLLHRSACDPMPQMLRLAPLRLHAPPAMSLLLRDDCVLWDGRALSLPIRIAIRSKRAKNLYPIPARPQMQ